MSTAPPLAQAALAQFDYTLPGELIAQQPVEPRDAARLLVLDRATGRREHRTFRDLADLLRPVDSEALNARLGYKHPPSAVRRLDDALLHVFAERYITLHGNAHREELLRARLAKMAG